METSKLRIELTSSDEMFGIGLVYLMVKGEKTADDKPKSVSKPGKDDFFTQARDLPGGKLPVAIRAKKEVFAKR
jgi:hypothetical protein